MELAGPVARVHPLHDVAGAGPAVVHRDHQRPGLVGGVDDVHRVGLGPGALEHPRAGDALGGDEAVVDLDDLVAVVPAQAGPARGVDRELDPGAPAQAVGVAGHRLDRHVQVEPGQPVQLLADDGGLELALVAQVGVLPVAPAAAAGTGERARRRPPVGGRLDHLDGVAEQEAVAHPAAGDPDPDTLPRQRVADEDHLAVVAGDAVAAVGDLADLRLEDGVDQGLRGGRGGLRGLVSAAHWPRRTEPAVGPSSRASVPSAERSCHGTLATMTPGVNSSRPLSRSALWLCSSCSYQAPTTYSGM